MKIIILLSSLLLLPAIFCDSDPHKDNDDPNWMIHLPSHIVPIVKSRLTTQTASSEGISSDIQGSNSAESLSSGETDAFTVPPQQGDYFTYSYSSSSNDEGAKIGGSIVGILILFLCCCACYKCCKNKQSTSHGYVVATHAPPPQLQPNSNIVINTYATPNLQPAQHVQQHPQFQHQFPQQFQHAPPNQQFKPPPSYPTGYETQQVQQQEWSPHAPMNQYPGHEYSSHNATAPPPSYTEQQSYNPGKY